MRDLVTTLALLVFAYGVISGLFAAKEHFDRRFCIERGSEYVSFGHGRGECLRTKVVR